MLNSYIISFCIGVLGFFICIYICFSYLLKEKEWLKKRYILIGVLLAVFSLVLAILSPFFFLNPDLFFSYEKIGGKLNDLMSPFIAIAASILTFIAFYSQYQANKQLQDQFKLQQFESQFYEMLRLHKENVNEMSVEGYEYKNKIEPNQTKDLYEKVNNHIKETNKGKSKNIVGRKIFYLLVAEFEATWVLLIKCYARNDPNFSNDRFCFPEEIKHDMIKVAYNIFFSGIKIFNKQRMGKELLSNESINNAFYECVYGELESLRKCHEKIGIRYIPRYIDFGNLERSIHLDFSYKPFGGHQIRLGHYYRHMFSLVKHVVSQPSQLLSYEDKRKYLKIFRAQLSNHEVVLLYYNWLGGYGADWEVQRHLLKNNIDGNRFFTDYRILHNLNSHLILEEFNPMDLFSNHEYDDFLFKGVRNLDLLFEGIEIESSLSEDKNNERKSKI
ncbi:putative phage abortive infection protein [Sphingobacterium paucimobilis]|uniref:Phage abortive infection protein n=1 Tax=Sphingobacterium paucimobilis HER1398 TaxID=1346330 RepID=U2HY01_9SPHI|nr:putative phage abortive infection protein [Sphingobacterium paucimobilis]ERJ60442.1 hypothetical protein M472_16945 [Sphingobacterium paucimobilis HER1398]